MFKHLSGNTIGLGLATAAALVAVGIYGWGEMGSTTGTRIDSSRTQSAKRLGTIHLAESTPPEQTSFISVPVIPSEVPPVSTLRQSSKKPISIPDLERQFQNTRDATARIGLVDEIAVFNDANAVRAIARLFSLEKLPDVKVALLAKLGDIDPDEATDTRYGILSAALERQPRDVRTTALEVVEAFDDPRADQLLVRASATDPDNEVRNIAKSFLEARRSSEAASQ